MLITDSCTDRKAGVSVNHLLELNTKSKVNERLFHLPNFIHMTFIFGHIGVNYVLPSSRERSTWIRERMTILNDRYKIVFTVLEKENLKEKSND
nr:MAG: hypothetical protein [uncultured archaeon]